MDKDKMRWSGAVDSGETTCHLLQCLVARGHEPVNVLSGFCDWLDELVKSGDLTDEQQMIQSVVRGFVDRYGLDR